MTMTDIRDEIAVHSQERRLNDNQFAYASIRLRGHKLSRTGYRILREPKDKVVVLW